MLSDPAAPLTLAQPLGLLHCSDNLSSLRLPLTQATASHSPLTQANMTPSGPVSLGHTRA